MRPDTTEYRYTSNKNIDNRIDPVYYYILEMIKISLLISILLLKTSS